GDANSGAITISAGGPAITHGNNLSLTTGAGVTINNNVTMAADKSLTVSAVGTIGFTPGSRTLAASGTGAISLTTARDISLSTGSNVTRVNGNITLSANQQASPTAGSFTGIFLASGAIVQSTGTGTLNIHGKGGTTGGKGISSNGQFNGGTAGTNVI